MEVISVIENEEVIKKTFKHLGLWEVKPSAPPKTRAVPTKTDTFIDDSFSQLLVSGNLSRASRSNEWLYEKERPPYDEAALFLTQKD